MKKHGGRKDLIQLSVCVSVCVCVCVSICLCPSLPIFSHSVHSFLDPTTMCKGFPSGKESACQCRSHRRCRFDPWVRKIPGGRNGNPIQYYCLGNPMDRGDWWITKSQTQLKRLSSSSSSSNLKLVTLLNQSRLPGWLLQCRRHRRCRFEFPLGKIPWNRKWKPTLVFLPGKSHGQRSLEGYSP